MQNSSVDVTTAKYWTKSCQSGILEMRDDITFANFERDAVSFLINVKGLTSLLRNELNRKGIILMNWHVILIVLEETSLRLK